MNIFSMAERDRRWQLAGGFLADQGLDALLVFGEHEDAGPAAVSFDTWFTNGRPGTTVIVRRDAEPISLLPAPMFLADHLESSRRGEQMWIRPQNLRAGRDSAAVIAALTDLGLAKAVIGVVGLGPHLPWHPEGVIGFGLWSRVLAGLPDTVFQPVDVEFGQLVMPLGAEEVAAVRRSARIGDDMVRAMVATTAPGVAENEIYAAAMAEAYRHGTVPASMHLWSGPDPVASSIPPWAYRTGEPRVLGAGDVIYAEVFSQVGGRHTQHQVSIAVGEVHEDFHRAAGVARAAYDAGLRALRPGRTFGQVVEAMQKPIDAAGGWPFLIAVHSLNPILALGSGRGHYTRIAGAEDYPDAHDHPAFLSDMVLTPGMSFALEPNYAFNRHLVHLGGTAIVGTDDPIELNPYTAQLLETS